MGFSSTLIIYKKYNKFKLSDQDINKITDLYVKYNKNRWFSDKEKSDDELKQDLPYVIDRGIDVEGNDFDRNNISDLRNRYFIDWHPADLVFQTDFYSSFRAISEEYGMGHSGDWKSNEIIISKEDAKEIAIAIRYLLNGKYDNSFEDILSNKWIRILGENYSKYTNRNIKKSDSLYLEKIDDECWKLSNKLDDPEDYENEDNLDWESTYKDFLNGLEIALSKPDYETDYDYVISYSISY